jgi:hypothetical protein
MATAITKTEGENLTHRVLWQCCLRQAEIARNIEKGRKYFDLTAMLMAYFTYEAYLNFVGSRVAAVDWANERAFFAKPPYQGTAGKLQRIVVVCGLPTVNKGTRPYQTIEHLARLRDLIAHAKPERYELEIEHSVDEERPMLGPYLLEKMVSVELRERAIADVEDFAEQIHKAVRPKVTDEWFGDSALRGLLGYASHSTKAKA